MNTRQHTPSYRHVATRLEHQAGKLPEQRLWLNVLLDAIREAEHPAMDPSLQAQAQLYIQRAEYFPVAASAGLEALWVMRLLKKIFPWATPPTERAA